MKNLIKAVLGYLGLENFGRAVYARISRRSIWLGHRIQLLLVRNRTLAASSGDLELILKLLRPEKVGTSLKRLGSNGDGGYLIPDDLIGIGSCFSPGVGENSDFEGDLAKLGIKSFLIDGTIEKLPFLDPLFHFTKKNLSVFPTSSSEVTFDEWVSANSNSADGDLILQMDIEGTEWGVLMNASNSLLEKFRIITIEFHDLHLISTKLGFDLIWSVLNKINKIFVVVHIHPNNWRIPININGIDIPPILEVTYLRRDRANFGVVNDFSNAKDVRNMPGLAEISLSRIWAN
jgi:hypothetical protein